MVSIEKVYNYLTEKHNFDINKSKVSMLMLMYENKDKKKDVDMMISLICNETLSEIIINSESYKSIKKDTIPLLKSQIMVLEKENKDLNDTIKDLFRLNKKSKKKLRFFRKVEDGVLDMGFYRVHRFYKNYVVLVK